MFAAAHNGDIFSIFGKLHRHLYADKSGSDDYYFLFGIGIVLHLVDIRYIFRDSKDAFKLQAMFKCRVDKRCRTCRKDKFVKAYLSLF